MDDQPRELARVSPDRIRSASDGVRRVQRADPKMVRIHSEANPADEGGLVGRDSAMGASRSMRCSIHGLGEGFQVSGFGLRITRVRASKSVPSP